MRRLPNVHYGVKEPGNDRLEPYCDVDPLSAWAPPAVDVRYVGCKNCQKKLVRDGHDPKIVGSEAA